MADCLLDHNLCKNFQNVCKENVFLTQEAQSEQVIEDDNLLHVGDQLPGEDESLPHKDLLLSGDALPPGESLLLPDEDLPLPSEVIHLSDEEQLLPSADHLEPGEDPPNKPKSKHVKRKTKKVSKKKEAALKCPWTRNHANKTSLKKDNTILNMRVTDRYGVPAAGLQVVTRRTYKDI